MCLLALAMSVKPLANVVADYARCNRHKKCDDVFQYRHLPSVARVKKGSKVIIPYFDKMRK